MRRYILLAVVLATFGLAPAFVRQSYASSSADYILPGQEFFSQVQRTSGTLDLKSTYESNSYTIRTLPEGWVVRVLSIADYNGANIDADGYRWYKVEDTTDGLAGYMTGLNLIDGTVYLGYDAGVQKDLELKTVQQATRADRIPIIEQAVADFTNPANNGSSLYNINGGADNGDNFRLLTVNNRFPKELIMGIVSQESGDAGYDNSYCGYAQNGRVGIMQIAAPTYEGRGSGVSDLLKSRTNCQGQSSSDYYSNSAQGIYANLKDGFRIVQDKYSATLSGLNSQAAACSTLYPCEGLDRVITAWRYNSLALGSGYIGALADRLSGLSNDFSGFIDQKLADDLSTEFRLASQNEIEAKLSSSNDLSVVDSSGHRTGIFNGVQSENIKSSAYAPENKSAVVFFPQDSYTYIVQGTSTGGYDLSVNNSGNISVPAPVFIQNVPTIPGRIHKYTIDWRAVHWGGKGVNIAVDRNGDGTYEYNFNTSANFNDPISPSTSIVLSGAIGNNGWYTSNVSVSFSAVDNAGGAGVYETDYSLDNGKTWRPYTAPFTLANEGAAVLLYRSEDLVGNVENAHSQTIKIDKTPPEAMVSFEPATGSPKIEGIDNLSVPTVTKTDNNNYVIADAAGHTLKIKVASIYSASIIDKSAALDLTVDSLKYDSDATITAPTTHLNYAWLGSPIKSLTGSISVLNQFSATEAYSSVSDTTSIATIRGNNLPTTQTVAGLKIIKLKTKSGSLGLE